jgi:hypothetical protein
LRIARHTEPFALLMGQLAYEGKDGPELAYRLERSRMSVIVPELAEWDKFFAATDELASRYLLPTEHQDHPHRWLGF